jgi:hypothetical protein
MNTHQSQHVQQALYGPSVWVNEELAGLVALSIKEEQDFIITWHNGNTTHTGQISALTSTTREGGDREGRESWRL